MQRISKVFFIILLYSLSICTGLNAQDDKDVALVLKTKGRVELNKQGVRGWATARRGQRLNSGQVVRTGDNSLAALVFTDDKTLLKIRSNSNVTIHGKRKNNRIIKRLSLGFGELWAKVTRQNTSMRVETPSGVATVKGTEFNCLFLNSNFYVYTVEGLMEVFNQFGTLLLGQNEMALVVQGAPPERYLGDPNELFNLSGDEGLKLEIEFEDDEGNKKKLILEF
jgi:ferric-dicitrate binding protein FerR (iron transport regulator)